jgi:hypothetical protein
MIVQHPEVCRTTFIFDINDRTPFDGERYRLPDEIDSTRYWRCVDDEDLRCWDFISRRVTAFEDIRLWLEERTGAFRITPVTMYSHYGHAIVAIAVQVPEDLAALFRMFCYDG